jgi:hypothetical protein
MAGVGPGGRRVTPARSHLFTCNPFYLVVVWRGQVVKGGVSLAGRTLSSRPGRAAPGRDFFAATARSSQKEVAPVVAGKRGYRRRTGASEVEAKVRRDLFRLSPASQECRSREEKYYPQGCQLNYLYPHRPLLLFRVRTTLVPPSRLTGATSTELTFRETRCGLAFLRPVVSTRTTLPCPRGPEPGSSLFGMLL